MDQPTLGLWILEMGIAVCVTGLYFWIAGEHRRAGIIVTIIGAITSLLTVKEVGNLMRVFTVAEIVGPAILLFTWGLLVYDIYLKKKKPAKITPKVASPDAPRLQVDFSGVTPAKNLVFKSDKITFVRKVGALISKERYESKHEFALLPSVPPRIDPGKAVECRVTGLRQEKSPDIRSLLDLLRSGSENTVNSVIVDYDDDHGHEFSRRFDLTRNEDDSIVWISEPIVHLRGGATTPEPQTKDLVDLHRDRELALRFPEEQKAVEKFGKRVEQEKQRLTTLRATLSDVLLAAQINLLVETAERLSDQFAAIIGENAAVTSSMDLSRPLTRELIILNSTEPIALPWQRLRLMSFRDRYSDHRIQVINRSLKEFDSPVVATTLPTDLPASDIAKILERHRTALSEKARTLAEPFFTAFNSDAIDPSLEASKVLREWQFPVSIAECPTTLTLQFNTGNILPEVVSAVNVWRWYALKTISDFRPREGAPVTIVNWLVFVAFERPVTFEQIKVDPRGVTLPMYEIKDRSARTFVAAFSGELAGTISFQAI